MPNVEHLNPKPNDEDTVVVPSDDTAVTTKPVVSNEVGTEPKLSKRALKRKLKHEKWLKWRPIKRAKEKEKLKQKRQHAKEHNIPLGPSRKALKLVKMENSENKLRVCIDFSFDHLMTQKDICKGVKQFNRCYSLNRRAQHPLQFFVSSFKDQSQREMQRYNGYQNWDVHIHKETYLELFEKEDIVYLTSDSDNVIEHLDHSKVYIIGGLVDHNQHKHVTLNKATEEKIAHGKLPISTYLNMKTRQVLTVNHVFEIMLLISSEKLSWKEAFVRTLPERKNIDVKEEPNCEVLVEQNDDDDEVEEERDDELEEEKDDDEEEEEMKENETNNEAVLDRESGQVLNEGKVPNNVTVVDHNLMESRIVKPEEVDNVQFDEVKR